MWNRTTLKRREEKRREEKRREEVNCGLFWGSVKDENKENNSDGWPSE